VVYYTYLYYSQPFYHFSILLVASLSTILKLYLYTLVLPLPAAVTLHNTSFHLPSFFFSPSSPHFYYIIFICCTNKFCFSILLLYPTRMLLPPKRMLVSFIYNMRYWINNAASGKLLHRHIWFGSKLAIIYYYWVIPPDEWSRIAYQSYMNQYCQHMEKISKKWLQVTETPIQITNYRWANLKIDVQNI
jgi:hypothetical protein